VASNTSLAGFSHTFLLPKPALLHVCAQTLLFQGHKERRTTFGSWMKLWPDRVFGGSSPVVTCFRHSMIVCSGMTSPSVTVGNP